MHTREEKLAIGEELNTMFKPVVQATEKAASENKKEIEELRGVLEPTPVKTPKVISVRNDDKTFGSYRISTGKLHLGVSDLKQEKARDGSDWLVVGPQKYEVTPGFSALLTQIHPTKYTEGDFENYTKLIAQTKVRSKSRTKSSCKP